MNEQLKFSWGHIIAFLALIIISYISFVGVTYLTDGDFTKASFATIIIDIILFVFFIGAQMMKATERKFSRRIWIERVFIFGSPIAFVIVMLPFFHFGSVHSKNDEIVNHFTEAINSSKQMFSDYDQYSNERIENYEHMLNRVISNHNIKPNEFVACGFTANNENIQKKNMIKTLRLQLRSHNYDSLKTEACKWIESSSNGASTWNVFLLGNTKEIKTAIHKWNEQLKEFSNNKLTNEEFNGFNTVKTFAEVSGSLNSVDNGLDRLTSKFTETSFPTLGSIVGAIFLYFCLLFPSILQDRHTKSQFRLIGMENGASSSSSMEIRPQNKPSQERKKKKIKMEEKDLVLEFYDDNHDVERPKINNNNDGNDDYASFTI